MIAKFFKDMFGGKKKVIPVKKQSSPTIKKDVDKVQLTPKEKATKRKEPWVDVITFNVNKENIRHGFYELDWNEFFIMQLKNEGYGFDGDPDEEIVSRWFRDICINAAAEEGVDMTDRATGIIDINSILKNKNT